MVHEGDGHVDHIAGSGDCGCDDPCLALLWSSFGTTQSFRVRGRGQQESHHVVWADLTGPATIPPSRQHSRELVSQNPT